MRKAGAKEDSEGSIGTEGAVDVNQSPFSTALTGRHSDSMIGLCSCTARSSSSSLRNLNNTYISMTCKGCGGESTTDGGPSCSSKVNTMGLELPRPIDPEVRWKTVNRRQRAARRARTSFSGEDRMMGEMRSFCALGSVSTLKMAHVDAPVSESEKLGVSILGRRFSDPMENIPIKKRRFHTDCSPSPPSTPLLEDPFEKILSRSCGGISGKRRKFKLLGCENREWKKGPFDADDFSGISILAAAACESEMDDDIFNGECSKSVHSLEERKLDNNTSGHSERSLLHEIKEDNLNIKDASHCKLDMPLGSSKSAPDLKPLIPAVFSSSVNLVESVIAPKENHALSSSFSNANKTDDSSSVSDAKSSDVVVSNDSFNPDKSVGCLEDAIVQTKCSNGTRDSRLHWDLNVAMEAWDTNCGDGDADMAGPDPVASAVKNCNGAANRMNKPQLCQDLFDPPVSGDIPDLCGDKIDVVDVPRDVGAKGENVFPGDSPSHPLCSQAHQNLQLLESESLDGNYAESKDLPEQQKGNYICKVESHLDSNPDCSTLAPIAEHVALSEDVGKRLDFSHALPLDFEVLSHSASADGHVEGNSIQTSELGSHAKPLASRLVSEESTNLATHTILNKSYTDLGNKHGQASQQCISEFKNQELLDVDSGTSKIDQSVNNKAEHHTYLLGLPKGTEDTDNDLDLPDPHFVNNTGSSDWEVAHGHEGDGVSATVNHKNSVITCANSSSTETYYIASNGPQVPGPSSKYTKPVATDMNIIVDSQAVAHSYPNGYRNEIGKVASNSCLENCYETDASHISKDFAGTRKVDVEEDDSQYEDGELRESGDRFWADDGYEEVKCVNYKVSNYKDEEGAIDVTPLLAGSISKNMGIPVAGYNEIQSRKEDDNISPISSKRSWSTNCLDDRSGMVVPGSAGEKACSVHLRMKGENQMYKTNSGCIISGSVGTASQSERCSDGLGDDLLSMRTKSTGWDMLPEDQRHPRPNARDRDDSSNRCALSTLDAAGGGEPLRQVGAGLSNRDVHRPAERPRSFDRPQRSELFRSGDDYVSGSKVERTVDSHRLHGRGGASRHIHASNRGEQWVENSNHSRSTRRRSPDYYNHSPPGPRNAAEAAVAKMESNGFVVARDGTLVRAADIANAGSMGRRMRNSLSGSYRPLSGRGSSIDRDGTCRLSRGPGHAREVSPERRFGATGSRSGRHGPEMDKDRTSDANMSSIRCSLPSRQQRFPPNSASLNLSHAHSRSRSGSRSRSPHAWTSPRNRRDIMANGGANLRRHSRSPPNYMTEVRVGRITSPQRQTGFDDRARGYSPSSRNHTYSQHASTWVNGRNCSTADLSDNKKRYSRRSPPLRIPSRSDRFDVMDSQGRPRSGESYRATQGRLPYDFERGRGNKHDQNGDDQREYAERYDTHSVTYDRNGSVKQFGNHTGDKLRPRISAPRSPEHQRRGSPRRFDRGFDRQLDADLPRGTKEENKNSFRYD